MGRAPEGKDGDPFPAPSHDLSGHIAAGMRPTEAQRRYNFKSKTTLES
jgi:hypothetical protein